MTGAIELTASFHLAPNLQDTDPHVQVPADDLEASPQAFIKEISSDGNLNTVDIIFQTWPVFISLNPDYIRLLWEPIMSYSASGRWPKEYVIVSVLPNEFAWGSSDTGLRSMTWEPVSTLLQTPPDWYCGLV